MSAHAIPLIDVTSLFGGPSPQRDRADRAVMQAATDIGFMTVTGLPGDVLCVAARKKLLSIFSLPDAAKRRMYRWNFDPSRSSILHGWFPLQPGHPTWKEGIDMGPDVAYGAARTQPGDPLTEATPIPDEAALPGWRDAVAAYYRAMEEVGAAMMRSIARGLDLVDTAFDGAFAQGISTLRLARYPARTPESFNGASEDIIIEHDGVRCYMLGRAHADSGFVTLLAQDGIEGLQAEARDGTWVTVPPIEGTLAVNFGKLLQRWSGGRIRATTHRVIGNGTERFSIPFFFEPAVDAVIAPIKGLSDDFAPFSYGDHLWESATQFVEQKGIAHLRPPRGVTRAVPTLAVGESSVCRAPR